MPGTLAYISPERLAGKDAGPAADVWAAGVMLWESLAGYHPFWTSSLLETARRIGDGARAARHGAARPAEAAAGRGRLDARARPRRAALRGAARDGAARERTAPRAEPKQKARPKLLRPKTPEPVPRGLPLARILPAAAAGLFAGWAAARLPFFPAGWDAGLAIVAAALTLVNRRAGLALALAVPVFPLGNISSGLALLYAALALGWLALVLARRRAAGSSSCSAPCSRRSGCSACCRSLAQTVRGRVRRAAQTAAAVFLAALVAGLRLVPLPFGAGPPPADLSLTGSQRPVAVAEELVRALLAHPVLLIEAGRRSRPPPCSSRYARAATGSGAPPASAPALLAATLLAAARRRPAARPRRSPPGPPPLALAWRADPGSASSWAGRAAR